MNGSVTHRSPLRVDVTSSSEEATHHDDSSPYSLTDSAMGGSAMSPEPLDENQSPASAHDKSHCSSMSDDREVNFESYGENNDVEYEQWVLIYFYSSKFFCRWSFVSYSVIIFHDSSFLSLNVVNFVIILPKNQT